jgi:hypothetical protein
MYLSAAQTERIAQFASQLADYVYGLGFLPPDQYAVTQALSAPRLLVEALPEPARNQKVFHSC